MALGSKSSLSVAFNSEQYDRNVYKTLPDRFTSYMLDGPGELQRSSDLTQSQYFHGKQGAPELNGMLSDSPMRYLRYDAEYPVEFVAKSTPIINNERPLFTMTWGFQINSQSETIDLRPTIDFNPMPFNGSYFTDAHQICLLYTSPSPRDRQKSRMPSSA